MPLSLANGSPSQNSFNSKNPSYSIEAANSNPANPADQIMCACNEAALLRTVSKNDSPNHGRQFYSCGKPRGSQCQFFLWAGGNPSHVPVNGGTASVSISRQVACLKLLILGIAYLQCDNI